MVQRTIQILIQPSHPDWDRAREQSSSVRRLYNGLNSIARIQHSLTQLKVTSEEEKPVDLRLVEIYQAQEWLDKNHSLAGSYSYEGLRKLVAHQQDITLPQKIAQRVGIQLAKNWRSFYALRKDGIYSNPPGYKRQYGVVEYTKQALSIRKPGYVIPSGWVSGVEIPAHITQVQAVRLKHSHHKTFTLEIVYKVSDPVQKSEGYSASIDFGLNNLITLITTKPGERPKVVSGRGLKSVNQFYNKRSSQLKQRLVKGGETRSHRLDTLWAKRNRKVKHYLHSVSSQVIQYLVNTGVTELVVGWNNGFKDKIKLGKRTNQNFVTLPHAQLRNMLTYKAIQAGLKVVIQEESYTSKSSFKHADPLPVFEKGVKHSFSGKRVSRGLYKNKDNTTIHADVNGAWNILRKSKPTTRWSNGVIVTPERLIITY